jgi:hypothetical protein
LVKGRRLPVEIDFITDFGKSIDYAVFISNWVSGKGSSDDKNGVYLANIKSETCSIDNPDSCPVKTGNGYTLKTNLYGDWDLKTTDQNPLGIGKTSVSVLPASINNSSIC